MFPSVCMAALISLAPALAAAPPAGDGNRGNQSRTEKTVDKKGPGWESKLYAEPRIGAFAFSSGGQTSTGVSIGAEAGIRYWQVRRDYPLLRGRTRIAGDYVLATSSASGMEARLGSFLGPYWKNVGLQAGPDVFWNRYSYGGVDLDPTIGVAIPVTALAWTKNHELSGSVGIEPAFLTNPDRRVDWSEQSVPGFGHEFTYRAGIGLSVSGLSLSAGYSYKITAAGGNHGISVGVGI